MLFEVVAAARAAISSGRVQERRRCRAPRSGFELGLHRRELLGLGGDLLDQLCDAVGVEDRHILCRGAGPVPRGKAREAARAMRLALRGSAAPPCRRHRRRRRIGAQLRAVGPFGRRSRRQLPSKRAAASADLRATAAWAHQAISFQKPGLPRQPSGPPSAVRRRRAPSSRLPRDRRSMSTIALAPPERDQCRPRLERARHRRSRASRSRGQAASSSAVLARVRSGRDRPSPPTEDRAAGLASR